MSGQGFGDHEADELLANEPGLERVVTALTADGVATELVGRQAALTMFRTVRDAQVAQGGSPAPGRVPALPGSPLSSGSPLPTRAPGAPDATVVRPATGARRPRAPRAPKSPRSPRSPRALGPAGLSRFPALVATATTLVVVCAAATAAAYAAALPSPVQQIAHQVFAPLGIPTAPPAAPQSPAPSPGQGSGPASGGGHGPGGSGSASAGPSGSSGPGSSGKPPNGGTPAPTGSPTASASGTPTPTPTVTSPAPGPVTVTLIAASPHVAPGGQDTFTASVTQAGQPVAQVTVRLLEREAGSPAARAAATGVTDATGMVALTATGLTVNAVFHVEGTAAYKAASSPKVTVQVIPGLAVHLSTPTTLMVHAGLPAGPGDAVTLQELSGGIWTDVATRVLGAQGRASFTVVDGQTYRVVLRATMTHGRAISVAVTA